MKTIYSLLKEILFWAIALVNEAPCRICSRTLAFTASENFIHANRHICRECLAYLSKPETGKLILGSSEQSKHSLSSCSYGNSTFVYVALSPYEDLSKELIALIKQKAEHHLLLDLAFPLYCLLDKITFALEAQRNEIFNSSGGSSPTTPTRPTYLLIPIPMHENKLEQRKKNHAKLIAGHLEHNALTQSLFRKKSLRLELAEEVLMQIRETKPQKYLNKRERRLNVQNAFALGKGAAKIKGKDVILIDDVLTSGATMYEAVKELGKSQPRSILICTLARTIKRVET
ncbi:MAG: hypothetical protein K2Y32_21450 [Candidatus Obscuribacterales bacterium]|nr:hypothetical protein [Candidatus Obscuribacterales bacterium]